MLIDAKMRHSLFYINLPGNLPSKNSCKLQFHTKNKDIEFLGFSATTLLNSNASFCFSFEDYIDQSVPIKERQKGK